MTEGMCYFLLSRDAQWWHEWEQSRSHGSGSVCVATAEQSCMVWHGARIRAVHLCEELAREKLPHGNVFLLSPKDLESHSCACSLAGNHTAQVKHL